MVTPLAFPGAGDVIKTHPRGLAPDTLYDGTREILSLTHSDENGIR